MICLALECSTPRRSVAVARHQHVLAEISQPTGRPAELLALVDKAMAAACVTREAIETLAVGLGPGSYTGVRGAIAMAQGWALGRSVRLLGIGSVDACARRCWRRGLRGHLMIVVDAQRDEFYVAEFDLTESEASPRLPLRLAPRSHVVERQRTGVILAGPELAANGWAGIEVAPDAGAVAELAAGRSDFIPGEQLAPLYLRATTFLKAPVARVRGPNHGQ